jgi:hypothetical protein
MGLVWIRLGILETPVFQQLLDTNKIEKVPIIEVCKKQPREIILSALLRTSEQAPFYIFTAFIFAYAVGTLHMSRDSSSPRCVSFVSIPLFGHISDRIGRKKMYLIGVVLTGLFDSYISGWWIWQSRHPVGGLHRHRALAHSPRYAIRTAGGADRGVIHTALAVQRRLPRLSARIHNCRRPRANHRHRAVRRLSYGLCDREDFSRANRDFPAML